MMPRTTLTKVNIDLNGFSNFNFTDKEFPYPGHALTLIAFPKKMGEVNNAKEEEFDEDGFEEEEEFDEDDFEEEEEFDEDDLEDEEFDDDELDAGMEDEDVSYFIDDETMDDDQSDDEYFYGEYDE